MVSRGKAHDEMFDDFQARDEWVGRPEFRDALLQQTTSTVRLRRRIRRCGYATGLIVCYGLGLLTMTLGAPKSAEGDPNARVTANSEHQGSATDRINQSRSELPDRQQAEAVETSNNNDRRPPQGPVRVVRSATTSQDVHRQPSSINQPPRKNSKTRFDSLRELGDQYLVERNDPAGALRCYRLALKWASQNDSLASITGGTWLFRAIKQDFEQEISHVNTNG